MKRSELFEAALALLLILLTFTLCLAILSGSRVADQWAIMGPVAHTGLWAYDNMYAPGNGMLYTVDGSSIYAIGEDGRIKYVLAIPDKYGINPRAEKWTGMAAAADGNGLYIIVGPGNQPEKGELLAIGPDGTPRWVAPLTFSLAPYYFSQAGLHLEGGRIYVHHYRNQLILDANGSVLRNINGVYEPATVDPAGNMYAYSRDNDTIEAYDRDGALRWGRPIGGYNASVLAGFRIEQPYYRNGTVYVWLTNGVMALDTNGEKLWVKEYPDMYTFVDPYAPFDGQGNLYLRHYNYGPNFDGDFNGSYISVIRPDGGELTGSKHPASYILGVLGLSDGVYYGPEREIPAGVDDPLNADHYQDPGSVEFILKQSRGNWNTSRTLGQLDTYAIRAVDIPTDRERWNATLPLFPHEIVLDAANIGLILPPYLNTSYADGENQVTPAAWYGDNGIANGAKLIGSWADVQLLPGENVTYVSLWTFNYEVPTFYGRSRAAYSGGIYALDRDGKLLWARPTGSRVTGMKEVNGTIYYGTDDGRLSAAKINLAAGLALTAVFYLFFRFFMAGAVTRARGRLDRNENRNGVLRFIADNPGSGLYDISKGLQMNIGTARYHLLILSINHRVVSFRADGKHIRYFTNSGSYPADEQSIISLMRRDNMRRALGALLRDPGLSNRELSRRLELGDSAMNRYMKELLERGIVENDRNAEGRTSYIIRTEYREKIAILMEKSG